ncbi:ATP-dependent DNA helicase pif1 [Eumeta japonica]|nr:ATP-dependent DNA helicase pif1 [Eumeta japonica]
MAVFGIASENANDEISNFQMGRYVSTNEALWRLLSFQIHERYPTVVHLAVHLENGQRVYFTEANAAQRAERPPSTTLTSFFAMCEADPFAATLMYVEMPKYYTWNQSTKKFQRRKQGTPVPDWPQVFSTDALGRMYTVHPRNDECFYLRLLLVNVRGPKSFAHLKTVNGHQCQTYREACQLLGLLENDSHWDLTLADSVVSSNAYQIRTLFAIIITTCFPSQPIQLWNKYKDAICEDILHRLRIQTNNPDIQITDEIYNEGLILIEDQCLTIANKLLIEVGMIAPNRSMHDSFNQELNRELQYNVDTLQEFVRNNVPLLNEQQNKCDIALALASSGIAATLLDGGRTAHSALKLPLNLNTIDTPTCNISRSSAMGKLLMQCKLIVWDECTMAHKKSLEALNFTLKDLRRNNNIFGGLMILLAGDFRQTLPVVPVERLQMN